MFDNFALECVPIPATAVLVHAPKVELEFTPACRRAFEGRIRSFCNGCILRSSTGCEVDRLEDFLVQLPCFWTFEWKLEQGEGVSQSLNSKSNRAVAHVRISRLFDGVEVDIDDPVEVACGVIGHIIEQLVIEGLAL